MEKMRVPVVKVTPTIHDFMSLMSENTNEKELRTMSSNFEDLMAPTIIVALDAFFFIASRKREARE
jgi:presenilin-like A22 family membrane protease